MIVVFAPTLMLQVFLTYFIVKVLSLNLSVDFLTYFDFFLWSMTLIVPAMFTIYIGAVTTKKAKNFCNQIGKILNFCGEESEALKRVRIFKFSC